jgi:hypothetical protein
MESRLFVCPRGEPERPANLHESVRRLLRRRYLMAVGLSAAACIVLGSPSALAGDVTQSNDNGAATAVSGPSGLSVAGIGVAGPIVAPITLGGGLNLNGPTNVNVAGNQNNSGNASNETVGQSNSNHSTTAVDSPNGADAAGIGHAGALVVPITLGGGVNQNGPLNVNVLGNQDSSGNAVNDTVQQSNANSSTTVADAPTGVAVAGIGQAGPVVAPITGQLGVNLNGPTNINALGNQNESGNSVNNKVSQSNSNHSTTVADVPTGEAVSGIGVAGPIVAPVTGALQVNDNGPFNVNALSNQENSGNAVNGDVSQANRNSSVTSAKAPTGAAVSGIGVAGPIVAPITAQGAGNVNGPNNLNGLSNQDTSGNAVNNSVHQANWNSAATFADAPGSAVAGIGVAGPIVAPITGAGQLNENGPLNGNLLANQQDSGNALNGDVWQSNVNQSLTAADVPTGAAATGIGVAGPVVVPVTGQLAGNFNGPTNFNGLSNQDTSGNALNDTVHQSNWNSAATFANEPTRAAVAGIGVAGPIVAPITGAGQLNENGPLNGNLLSNQNESGNAGNNDVWQSNSNEAFLWTDQPTGATGAIIGTAGPIAAPITSQVAGNLNGPTNLNGLSNQDGSGNARNCVVQQLNRNRAFTFVDQAHDLSVAGIGVAGGGTVPVTGGPEVNINGPTNGQVLSNMETSGNVGCGASEARAATPKR